MNEQLNPAEEALEATRSSLLTRLRNLEDREAWFDFFEMYWKLVYNFARKSGLGAMDAEDVVQETVRQVARQMAEFKYNRVKGTFRGWLMTVARRRVMDHFRRESRRPMIGGELGAIEDQADARADELERLWNSEWADWLVNLALERVKQQVSARQYQLFHAYVIREWPVMEVGEMFDASRDQIYQAKRRVGKVFEAALLDLKEQD